MAFYTPLPDGFSLVQTDDGRELRTALAPEQLEAQGVTRAEGPPKPPEIDLAKYQTPPEMRELNNANAVAGPGGGDLVYQQNPAGLKLPQGFEPYVAPPKPKVAPVTVPPQSAPQQSEPPQNAEARRVYEIALANSVRRTAPSPGGVVPSTKTVQRGETPSPKDLQRVDEAERAQEAQRVESVKGLGDSMQRDVIDPQMALLAKQQRELEEAAAKRREYDAKLSQLSDYARKQEERAASMKTLSPSDELFKGGGGFVARIISAIGVAMGAYSAAKTGGENAALRIAENAVKDKADELRMQYEQAQAAGRSARNAYSDALQHYGNPELALQALRDRGDAIYRRMLELNMLKHGTPEMIAKVQQDNAAAEVERQKRWADRNAKAAGATAESYKYVPPSGGGVAIDAKMLGLAGDMAGKLGVKPEEAEKELARAVRLPTGEFAYATNPGAAQKIQEQIKVDNRIHEMAERIRHLREQPGAKTDPKLRAKIKGAAADLFLALKSGANLGTLDKGSLEFRDDWLGKPTDLIDFGGADALLEEVGGAARQRVEDTVRYDLHNSPRGVSPVRGAQPKGVQSDE